MTKRQSTSLEFDRLLLYPSEASLLTKEVMGLFTEGQLRPSRLLIINKWRCHTSNAAELFEHERVRSTAFMICDPNGSGNK